MCFGLYEQAIDLISVVKEIHGLNSQELNKLLRDSENFTIHFVTEKGLEVKVQPPHVIFVASFFCFFTETSHIKLCYLSD